MDIAQDGQEQRYEQFAKRQGLTSLNRKLYMLSMLQLPDDLPYMPCFVLHARRNPDICTLLPKLPPLQDKLSTD